MSSEGEHLIRMAHDIAANTRGGKTDTEAVEAIANHLRRFWTPKMRERLAALCVDHPDKFTCNVSSAIQSLSQD